jgi:hypothetical protein
MPGVPWWRPIALAMFAVTGIFFLTQHPGSDAAPAAEKIDRELQARCRAQM